MNKMDFDELTMNESLEIEGGGLVEDLGRLTGKVLYYFCKAADRLTAAGEMERWNRNNK